MALFLTITHQFFVIFDHYCTIKCFLWLSASHWSAWHFSLYETDKILDTCGLRGLSVMKLFDSRDLFCEQFSTSQGTMKWQWIEQIPYCKMTLISRIWIYWYVYNRCQHTHVFRCWATHSANIFLKIRIQHISSAGPLIISVVLSLLSRALFDSEG